MYDCIEKLQHVSIFPSSVSLTYCRELIDYVVLSSTFLHNFFLNKNIGRWTKEWGILRYRKNNFFQKIICHPTIKCSQSQRHCIVSLARICQLQSSIKHILPRTMAFLVSSLFLAFCIFAHVLLAAGMWNPASKPCHWPLEIVADRKFWTIEM